MSLHAICMSLHAISVFDEVWKWSPEKNALFKSIIKKISASKSEIRHVTFSVSKTNEGKMLEERERKKSWKYFEENACTQAVAKEKKSCLCSMYNFLLIDLTISTYSISDQVLTDNFYVTFPQNDNWELNCNFDLQKVLKVVFSLSRYLWIIITMINPSRNGLFWHSNQWGKRVWWHRSFIVHVDFHFWGHWVMIWTAIF